MIPPSGFNKTLYPLFHKLEYSVGLSGLQAAVNSTILTFVKNYDASNVPNTVIVNPHNTALDIETGAICGKMSIIDRLKIQMHFTLTEDALADGMESAIVQYMPIFTSFPEKLDSTDDDTGTTAAAILELTKDATEEDITPAFSTKLNLGLGGSHLAHPVSTVNFTEVFGTLNLTTNLTMEGVPWDMDVFYDAIRRYTNKGAIKSMIGKVRSVHLTKNNPTKRIFINKFVPRTIRRIVPYTYFGMLVHTPIISDFNQPFSSGAITTAKAQIGVKCLVNYHEWNVDHNQDMA